MAGFLGFVILLSTAVGCSYILNLRLGKFFAAKEKSSVKNRTSNTTIELGGCFIRAILAATISTVLFQVFGYFIMGYLDPFFLIALIVGWLVSFPVCLVVGLLFLKRERGKTD